MLSSRDFTINAASHGVVCGMRARTQALEVQRAVAGVELRRTLCERRRLVFEPRLEAIHPLAVPAPGTHPQPIETLDSCSSLL